MTLAAFCSGKPKRAPMISRSPCLMPTASLLRMSPASGGYTCRQASNAGNRCCFSSFSSMAALDWQGFRAPSLCGKALYVAGMPLRGVDGGGTPCHASMHASHPQARLPKIPNKKPPAGRRLGSISYDFKTLTLLSRGAFILYFAQKAINSSPPRPLHHRRLRCRLPARFAPPLRVAHGYAMVPTGHTLPFGAFASAPRHRM